MRERRKSPKHARIASQVRRSIRTRSLKTGQAIPTEQELAREFECSRGTVRRALDTLVHEGLIRRKQGAGHFVARSPDADHAPLIGLILPNILNAEMLRLAQGFTLKAGSRGYRLLLGVMENEPAAEREFISDLHRLKVAGLLKFPTTPECETELRAHIRSLGLPYVILNDFWTDSRRDHHVAFDEAAAIEDIIKHLVDLGHTRIGWVDGSDGLRKHAATVLRNTLATYNLSMPEHRALMCLPYEPPPVESLYRNPAKAPTALITPYDGMAVRLIEALDRLGLEVPRDVSVVCMNGPAFYTASGIEFTCSIPPDEQLIAKALEILIDTPHEQAVCQYLFKSGFHRVRTSAPPPTAAVKHVTRPPARESKTIPSLSLT